MTGPRAPEIRSTNSDAPALLNFTATAPVQMEYGVAPMEILRRTTGVNQSLQTRLCAPRRPVGCGHGPTPGRPSGVLVQRAKRRVSARLGAGRPLLSATLPVPLCIASTALAWSLSADTYYVSTEGNTENDGSRKRPWPTVEHALSRVGGGKTIIVRPGTDRSETSCPTFGPSRKPIR
jgi:hypothetical protein